jgi:hypothetical protein
MDESAGRTGARDASFLREASGLRDASGLRAAPPGQGR